MDRQGQDGSLVLHGLRLEYLHGQASDQFRGGLEREYVGLLREKVAAALLCCGRNCRLWEIVGIYGTQA